MTENMRPVISHDHLKGLFSYLGMTPENNPGAEIDDAFALIRQNEAEYLRENNNAFMTYAAWTEEPPPECVELLEPGADPVMVFIKVQHWKYPSINVVFGVVIPFRVVADRVGMLLEREDGAVYMDAHGVRAMIADTWSAGDNGPPATVDPGDALFDPASPPTPVPNKPKPN